MYDTLFSGMLSQYLDEFHDKILTHNDDTELLTIPVLTIMNAVSECFISLDNFFNTNIIC